MRLAWDEVDFDTNTIRIVNDPAGRQHTKTAEERIVPMVPILRALLRQLPRHVTSPYVFFRRNGSRYREVKNGFANAVDCAELNPTPRPGETGAAFHQRYERYKVTPHTLRHSGLTLLAEHGIDPWDLMRWGGHKTIQTSMKYIHLARTRKREIERVPVDDIRFIESDVFEAHVYSHVYSEAERSGRG